MLLSKGSWPLPDPLNNLTRKDTPWTWEKEEQDAFNTLKRRITEDPILRQPQLNKQFELEVDASGYAIGAVLMQRQEDGKRHPVGFYSTTLNNAEHNYDIYNKELLACYVSLYLYVFGFWLALTRRPISLSWDQYHVICTYMTPSQDY